MGEKKRATEVAQHIYINCINTLTGSLCKDNENEYFIQEQTVFISLKECPKTMKMVEVETGIDRANICRYIHNFREQGRVHVHHIGTCPITNYRKVSFWEKGEIL